MKGGTTRRLHADTRGAASIEFAVAGLTILVLLLGVFDAGLLFMNQRGLDYGIYRAARWASVNGSSASIGNILAQFQSATAASLPNSGTCVGFAAAASVPAGTACYIKVGYSNGTAVGSVVSIQAGFAWSPASPVTGFTAATLGSSIALAIQH